MGDQVGRAIAGLGLIMADLAEQPVDRGRASLGAGRQDRGELRVGQPFGQHLFRFGQIFRAGIAGDLDQQIGHGIPVPGQVRSGARRGSVSVH